MRWLESDIHGEIENETHIEMLLLTSLAAV
jgi:hypothetical protein